MFESIRKHSKIVMLLLFLLIIPSFIFVGVDSNYFTEKSPVVARVAGSKITQADWDAAHKIQADEIRTRSPGVDPKLLDSPQARYATLERLVRDKVLEAAVKDLHLTASNARLARALQEIPAIAALRRPDGTLDTAAYADLLAQNANTTPAAFEANMRRDLSLQQVMAGVMGTGFSTEAQTKLALDNLYQRREIQIQRFKATDFVAKVTPTDEQLNTYYQANLSKFQLPEQADVEFLVLDIDTVRAAINPSEADLRTYYQENLARLTAKEERRASHILIAASKDAPAADREKAKARAQELLAQVRAAPATFAEVAKKSSDDTSSAVQGGDLNFFAPGAMVKPFEAAAFAMKKGEISDVVETDFGFHIIQLTDIKTPKVPSFEELRRTLETELRQQQAQKQFAEAAENFTNLVFDQPDSLQPAADKLQLKIQKATGIGRNPAAQAKGPLANQRLLEALFAADALEAKRNTQAIEIGSNQLASARIVQYTPARTQPFDEVKTTVRQMFIAHESAQLARKEGEAAMASYQAGTTNPGLPAAIVIGRDQTQSQPREIIDAALRADTSKLPAWTGISLGDQGYAVIKVNKIIPREVQADIAAQQQRQVTQWWTSAEGLAYYEWLKKRFKVQITPERPAAYEAS